MLSVLNILIHEVYRKFDKNRIKAWKIGTFLVIFLHFQCQFEIFFIWKTAFISSEKPTEQRIRAMLSVFNILIHEVYRKFDKNSIKTLKIGKFLGILSFLGPWGQLKKSKNLHKYKSHEAKFM